MSGELTAVREVWAQRSQARTRADVLYLLYVVALSALVIAAPGLQMAGSLLARPDVIPALAHPLAPQATTSLAFAAAAALVLLGAVRGPALLPPFFTATLAASGIRRRTALWRPLARALLVPVLAALTAAALVAVTLVSAAHAATSGAVHFVIAAAGTGLLLGGAWLSGELLRGGARRLLAGGLAAASVLGSFLPGMPGPGRAYPMASEGMGTAPGVGLWAPGLLLAGLLVSGVGILLLDRVRGSVLREQAARWDSAGTLATTGDLAGASGMFRTPPSAGRRLRAIGPRPLVLLYARRDAVSWLRSPERFVVGVVTSLLAAAVLAGSTLLTGPLSWGAVLLGAAALWGAGGTLVDGIRHGVHTLGAPALFGQSAATQVVLHAIAPLLLLSLLAALGGTLTGVVAAGFAVDGGPGLSGTGLWEAVLLPVALAPVMIIGRVRDAAKGPLPLALVTPMPTAQGDLSILPMLAWQSDAILLALVCGAVLAGLGLLGPAWLLGGAVVLTAVMALMARVRLRELTR
ncbi:hypothetical protein [Brachybacterium sp.]|uniref:hypothetical protein n=1 Tax=Brachybacterium sp. TaxID=1891286 RepID=UPI002ED07F5B